MRRCRIIALLPVIGCGEGPGAIGVHTAASTQQVGEVPRNGVDDTLALEAALATCVPGGPACVVQLGAGVYRSGQIVVTGFHGTIRGHGMDETVLEALAGFEVTQDNGPLGAFSNPPSPTNPWPAIVTFWDSPSVTLEDLGVRVGEFEPTTGWYYGHDFFVTWLKAAIIVQGDAHFLRVGFDGGPGTLEGVNLDNGPMVTDASNPTVEMRGCRTRTAGNGFEVALSEGATITIGGSEEDGNQFRDSGGGLFYGIDSSTVEYSHNQLRSLVPFWFAIALINDQDVVYDGVSQVAIHDNKIELLGDTLAGIVIQDTQLFLGGRSLAVDIDHNRIGAEGAPLAHGIRADISSGLRIAGNRFHGTMQTAVRANRSDTCLIEGNDMHRLTATLVPIWLRAFSSGCTAIVDDPAEVRDQGTGNTVIVR